MYSSGLVWLTLFNHAMAQSSYYTSLTMGGVPPGLTASCAASMNVTISNCPGFLLSASTNNYRLNLDQLGALCTSSCQTSLSNVQSAVAKACTSVNDTMTLPSGTFPVTVIIDRYIYTYKVACRKDKITSQYCDQIFYSWLNQTSLTSAQNCSDCSLGVAQIQLNSPFGYDTIFDQEFRALTSSCSATGYSFTTPAPYSSAVSISTTTTASTSSGSAATSACAQTYTVQSGDSCDSVALAQNISTYNVLSAGALRPDCSNLLVGTNLCFPGPCSLYRVQAGDTCATIISGLGSVITGTQFISWNPNINSLCGNINNLVGTLICVSPPGGGVANPQITTDLAISTATTPVAKPTNAPAESNSRCGTWYRVAAGDTCDKVSITQNIQLKDFYFLNPEINANCTNLNLGLAYCVQPVGNIATYSGYPATSAFYSLTSTSYNTSTQTLPVTSVRPTTAITYLPTASGTIPGCDFYVNNVNVPPIVDQSQYSRPQLLTSNINSCDYLTGAWNINMTQLLRWNPSLSATGSCSLQAGYSYCLLRNATTDQQGYIAAAKSCLPPRNIYPGTISTCNCYTRIDGVDNGSYVCSNIASDNNIAVTDIAKWNPWVGTSCDSGLYAGLAAGDIRAVCIGVSSTTPTTTTSSSSSAGSTAPTGSGTVSSCQQFYTVQSGDSCAKVDTQFSITFAQFYAWNPAVGSDCQYLQVGVQYCVKAPTTTTSVTTTTTSGVAAPTRSGTASGCSKYYTVVDNDSCQTIDTKFNLVFTTLYKWNTNLGSNCESLWVGYSLCVAGGPS